MSLKVSIDNGDDAGGKRRVSVGLEGQTPRKEFLFGRDDPIGITSKFDAEGGYRFGLGSSWSAYEDDGADGGRHSGEVGVGGDARWSNDNDEDDYNDEDEDERDYDYDNYSDRSGTDSDAYDGSPDLEELKERRLFTLPAGSILGYKSGSSNSSSSGSHNSNNSQSGDNYQSDPALGGLHFTGFNELGDLPSSPLADSSDLNADINARPSTSFGSRPKTSRGRSYPSPDDYFSYVIPSPEKDSDRLGRSGVLKISGGEDSETNSESEYLRSIDDSSDGDEDEGEEVEYERKGDRDEDSENNRDRYEEESESDPNAYDLESDASSLDRQWTGSGERIDPRVVALGCWLFGAGLKL
jgi:hypothetical protein